MSQMLALSPLGNQAVQPKRPVADITELRRYTAGNADLEREILDLFCRDTPVHFNCLRADCANETPCTPDQWHLAIHTIKCSAVTIGAFDTAQIALKILDMSFENRTAAHCREVRNLGNALNAVYAHVPSLVASL